MMAHTNIILLLVLILLVQTVISISPITFRSIPSSFDHRINEYIVEIDCKSPEYNFCNKPKIKYEFIINLDHPTLYCSNLSKAKITWYDDNYYSIGPEGGIDIELKGHHSQSRSSPQLAFPTTTASANIIGHILIINDVGCQPDDFTRRQVTDLATFSLTNIQPTPHYVETVKIAASIAPPLFQYSPSLLESSWGQPKGNFLIGKQFKSLTNQDNEDDSSLLTKAETNMIVFEAYFPPVDNNFVSMNYTSIQVIPTGLVQNFPKEDQFPWNDFSCSLGDPDSANAPVKASSRGEEHSKALVFSTTRWSYTPDLNKNEDKKVYGASNMPFVLRCEASVPEGSLVHPAAFKYPGFVVQLHSLNDINVGAIRFANDFVDDVQSTSNNLNFFDFQNISAPTKVNQLRSLRGSPIQADLTPLLLPIGPFFDVTITKSFPTIKNSPIQLRPSTTFVVWHMSQLLTVSSQADLDGTQGLDTFPFMSMQGIELEIVSPDLRKDKVRRQIQELEYTITCTLNAGTGSEYNVPVVTGIFELDTFWFPTPKLSELDQQQLFTSPFPRAKAKPSPKTEFYYKEAIKEIKIDQCKQFFITIVGKIDTLHKRSTSSSSPTSSHPELGLFLTTTHTYPKVGPHDPDQQLTTQENALTMSFTHTTELVTYTHHQVVMRDAIIATNDQLHLIIKNDQLNSNYLTFNITVTTKTLQGPLESPIFSISTPRYIFYKTDLSPTGPDTLCNVKKFVPESVNDSGIAVPISFVSPSWLQFKNTTLDVNPDKANPYVYHFSCPDIVLTKVTTDGTTGHTNHDIDYDDIVISLEVPANIENNKAFSKIWVSTDGRIPVIYFMTASLLSLGLLLTTIIICVVRRGTTRKRKEAELQEKLLLEQLSIQQVSWQEYDSTYTNPVITTGYDGNDTTGFVSFVHDYSSESIMSNGDSKKSHKNSKNKDPVVSGRNRDGVNQLIASQSYLDSMKNVNKDNDDGSFLIMYKTKGNTTTTLTTTTATTSPLTTQPSPLPQSISTSYIAPIPLEQHQLVRQDSFSVTIQPGSGKLRPDGTPQTQALAIPTNLAAQLDLDLDLDLDINSSPTLPQQIGIKNGNYHNNTSGTGGGGSLLIGSFPATRSFTKSPSAMSQPGIQVGTPSKSPLAPLVGSFQQASIPSAINTLGVNNSTILGSIQPQQQNQSAQNLPILRQISGLATASGAPLIENDYFDLSSTSSAPPPQQKQQSNKKNPGKKKETIARQGII